jgi:hypothetical protein
MKPIIALTVVATTLLAAAPAPAGTRSGEPASGARDGERCYRAVAEKRKTSVGVHQWTIRQIDRWCARASRVVSARQRLEIETGSGWRLISKRGRAAVKEGKAISRSRYHFRLRYSGGYEQNCYPRLVGRLRASGRARYRLDVGC